MRETVIHSGRPLRAVLMALLAFAAIVAFARAQQPAPPASPEVYQPTEAELETEGQMAAAQAIAEMERRRRSQQRSALRSNIQNLKTFEYELTGRDEEQLLRDASMRALKSTAARLYFGQYILVGRDLLEPYLGIYGDRFIIQRRVLSRSLQAGGTVRLRVRIGVDMDRLYSDLVDKRFLSTPKLRPIFAVLLSETDEGEQPDQPRGRLLIEDTLSIHDFRIESARLSGHGLGIDATATAESLSATRDEAQRWDIDVLVTGSLEVTARADQVVLFDQVFYKQAELVLRLVRVDTGEVLRSVTDKASAWGLSPEATLASLLETLLPRNAIKLTEGFQADWTNVMLDKADFRVMVTGVTPNDLNTVTTMLETISPAVTVHLKAFYGGVAVLNVNFPGSGADELERFLRRSRVPQFGVKRADERRFEIEIL